MSELLDRDVFDSRDVSERFDELGRLEEPTEEEHREMALLNELIVQGMDASDWEYGETIVADRYFVQYAKELAYDIGAVGGDAEWPVRHIDWQAAADELKQDYMVIELSDGSCFWVRG